MCVLKCSKCQHHYPIKKLYWEPSDISCGRPGFEGYTSDEDPVCGGTFYFPIKKAEVVL